MYSSQKSATSVKPGRSVLNVKPVMMAGSVLLNVSLMFTVMVMNTVTLKRVVRETVSRDAGNIFTFSIFKTRNNFNTFQKTVSYQTLIYIPVHTRNGSDCGVNNSEECGICENHVCNEPECCVDQDCHVSMFVL